jgi:hypothetical protein
VALSSIDANVYIQRADLKRKPVVRASDWKTIDGEKLLRRLEDDSYGTLWMTRAAEQLIPLASRNLACLTDQSGSVVGRAAVLPGNAFVGLGAIVNGGLRVCDLQRIAGVLQGSTLTASRNLAIPIVQSLALAEWASGQQPLVIRATTDQDDLAAAANTIGYCGGEIGSFPVAQSSRGWLSADDIRGWAPIPDEILIVEFGDLQSVASDLGPVELLPNALACEQEHPYFMEDHLWPNPIPWDRGPLTDRSTQSLVARLLAERWSTTLEEMLAVSSIKRGEDSEWVVIGTVNGRPIKRMAYVLRNPNAKRLPANTRKQRPHRKT